MAEYFQWKEFVRSEVADRLGIDNEPKEEPTQENILELMRFMDLIRKEWTEVCSDQGWNNPAIIITSGYRCDALNKAVGGSKTSEHKLGTAVDFKAANGRNKALFEVVKNYLKDTPFSQLINEKPDKNGEPSWIHFGMKGRIERPYRCQVLTIK